jgi:arginyl-tRNA synthetase
MEGLFKLIQEKCVAVIAIEYGINVEPSQLTVQITRKEFEGDITLVTFPLVKLLRKSPVELGARLGELLKKELEIIESCNVVQGFLNLKLTGKYWIDLFNTSYNTVGFGRRQISETTNPIVLEYSSPNTNKPLHLGHIRNNLLGYSVSELLKANGNRVVKVNLINDRGIHICKSMLAWQKWGNNETPESSGLKGDHLVGKYYVAFDKAFKAEIQGLIDAGVSKDDAEKQSVLMEEAREMLRKWEAEDQEVRQLWRKMNGWVYDGFSKTYSRMGVNFDKLYYESETYLLGKSLVQEGLSSGTLYQQENGSIWADLTEQGLDHKLLLRADGTSVYMTQDLGTAQLRYSEFTPSSMIYVVGNEQNYHFDALKIILKKLNKDWADSIRHLSYGMVELPDGKMKSREGTVVDADDLMDQMFETAKQMTEELGKSEDLDEKESTRLYSVISLAALKYFILKVDPKKTMLFNPRESIDFNGNTGPFIQYTYARIKSVIRKSQTALPLSSSFTLALEPKEIELVKLLNLYPDVINEAANALSPSLIAGYAYDLAKEYNQFYHELTILKESDEEKRLFRLALSSLTARVISDALSILGIEVPERM